MIKNDTIKKWTHMLVELTVGAPLRFSHKYGIPSDYTTPPAMEKTKRLLFNF